MQTEWFAWPLPAFMEAVSGTPHGFFVQHIYFPVQELIKRCLYRLRPHHDAAGGSRINCVEVWKLLSILLCKFRLLVWIAAF